MNASTPQSLGGKARAEVTTSEERSEQSRRAAEARWGTKILVTPYSGTWQLGDTTLECAVLEDGTRLVSQSGILSALGRGNPKSTKGREPFIAADNLQDFISDELKEQIVPLPFRVDGDGARKLGYKAHLIIDVCKVYLAARDAGVLTPNQLPIATQAAVLLSGVGKVGIDALIDEITGYQAVRDRQALQKLFYGYVGKEFRPWVKTFPDSFFIQVGRVHGWKIDSKTRSRVPAAGCGNFIVDYIYKQLPEGTLELLRKRNPRINGSSRAYKHHQWLTTNTGVPHLDEQIRIVTTLLFAAKDKEHFVELYKSWKENQA